MMRPILLSIFTVLLAGCATTSDPIIRVAKWVERVNFWEDRLFSIIKLPETASVEEVIAKFFQTYQFEQGKVTHYQILEARWVRIQGKLPDAYTAILVQTNLGRKVVLLQYDKSSHGWWNRVYDVDSKTHKITTT